MDLTEAEATLSAHPDYRLLHRIPPAADWRFLASGPHTRRAVFVDTETTGLDPDTDEVIELALLPFDYDRDTGAIYAVDEANAYCALREPSITIPPEATRIHGISNADVAGQRINTAEIERIVDGAQLIIAHNAAFDRPMVEQHWPIFEGKHWACSFVDIDWSADGLSSGKLDYLLMKQGWFFDAHRALGDALAGVYLLHLPLPVSKQPSLQALLKCARRPLRAVRAEDTAFELRAALKQRGYRWDPGDSRRPKAWWILTEDPATEVAWLNSEIYETPREIVVQDMPATRRYSSRLWPMA